MKKEFYLINITNPVVPIPPELYRFIYLKRTLLQNNSHEPRKKKNITFLLRLRKILSSYIKILRYIYNNQGKNYLILTQPPLLHYFILTLFPSVAKRSTLILMDLYPQLLLHQIEKYLIIKRVCNQIFLKPILWFNKIVFIADGPSFRFALKNSRCHNVFLARNLTSLPPLKRTVTKKLNNVRILYQGSFNATADSKYMKNLERVMNNTKTILTRNIKTGLFDSTKNIQNKVSDQELVNIMKINHFGLIILKKTISDYTNPSKFVSFLSQGLPVLYYGPLDNEIYHMIQDENCGIILPDEIDALQKFFKTDMLKDYRFFSNLQRNALKTYYKYYSQSTVKKSWQKII